MKAPIKSIVAIVAAYALVTKLSPTVVREGFLSAKVSDLKKVTNAAGTLALLMMQVHDQVEPELEKKLREDTFMKALMGDMGPAVDLSGFVEILEGGSKEPLKTAAAGHPVGEIKRRCGSSTVH